MKSVHSVKDNNNNNNYKWSDLTVKQSNNIMPEACFKHIGVVPTGSNTYFDSFRFVIIGRMELITNRIGTQTSYRKRERSFRILYYIREL